MIDSNVFSLANHPTVALETPQEIQFKKNALALQGQQIQGAQLGNQQTQNQLNATKAMNEAMSSAVTTGDDGVPKIDRDTIVKSLATNGQGSQIPAVLQRLNETDAAAVKLKSDKAALATSQADYGGIVGVTVRTAGYDPAVFIAHEKQAVAAGLIDPQQASALIQQVQQDPSRVKAITDQLIAGSPKQRQLDAEQATADARKTQADTQQHKFTAELPGINANNTAAQQKVAGTEPIQPKDQANIDTARINAGLHAKSVATQQGQLNVSRQRLANETQYTPPTGTEGLTGEALLKTLPSATAGTLRAMAAGRTLPPSVNSRSPAAQNLLGLLNQYDPSFKTGRFKLQQDLSDGPLSKTVISLNTAVQHMGEMYDAVNALGNGNTRALNSVANKFGYETGNGALPSAELAKTMVRGEIAKAATGGTVTVEEQQSIDKSLDTAQSLQSIAQVAKTAAHLLGGKVGAIHDQYNTTMGSHAEPMSLLSDASKGTLKRLGVDPSTVERQSAGGASASGGATHRFNPATGKIEAIQ
jgi:hypothetical protein